MQQSLWERFNYRMNMFDFREGLAIPENRLDEFKNWFDQHAVGLELNQEHLEGWQHERYIGNRCFGNSQDFSIAQGHPYFEGFVLFGDDLTHHGFVRAGDQAYDVTFLNAPENFVEKPVNSLYWGVEIPPAFYGEPAHRFHNTPRLVRYFLDQD